MAKTERELVEIFLDSAFKSAFRAHQAAQRLDLYGLEDDLQQIVLELGRLIRDVESNRKSLRKSSV